MSETQLMLPATFGGRMVALNKMIDTKTCLLAFSFSS